MSKNLELKLESTEKIHESLTSEILSLKDKISTCTEENAEIQNEIKNVTNKVKYWQNMLKK